MAEGIKGKIFICSLVLLNYELSSVKTIVYCFIALLILSVIHNQAVYARGSGGGARGYGGYHGGDFHGGYYHGGDFDRARGDVGATDLAPRADGGAWAGRAMYPGGVGRWGYDHAEVGHFTNRYNSVEMESRANAVRAGYGYAGVYDRHFWAVHPEAAWAYAGRWGDDWAWGYTGWPMLAGFWGMPIETAPTEYDYGNNITYQNENVYYGSQPVDTTAAYYNQAQTLAQSIPVTDTEASDKDGWKPLGVFSMVQGEQTNTTTMFQIAVNKKGALKGSYYNPLTGETQSLTGAVDKKSMRVSWIVGNDKNVVYDSGLANLLQPQSQLLVHYGKDKTQQWSLVRLEQTKTS